MDTLWCAEPLQSAVCTPQRTAQHDSEVMRDNAESEANCLGFAWTGAVHMQGRARGSVITIRIALVVSFNGQGGVSVDAVNAVNGE